MTSKKHSRCKATLIRTWRATVRQLKDAPVAIVAPVHGVFRSIIDMIELKGICPLHLDEAPDAVAATKKPRRASRAAAAVSARSQVRT
jgi:hypothetical protein